MGHYGKIWLCALGTAENLIMCYGPLHGMKVYSKNSDFHTMGHRFGYPLWAAAKDLVKRYGPWRSIWLCPIGHSAKPITIPQNNTTVFKSLPYPLRDSDAKKCMYINN
jgi:hypothetical protein